MHLVASTVSSIELALHATLYLYEKSSFCCCQKMSTVKVVYYLNLCFRIKNDFKKIDDSCHEKLNSLRKSNFDTFLRTWYYFSLQKYHIFHGVCWNLAKNLTTFDPTKVETCQSDWHYDTTHTLISCFITYNMRICSG